MQLYRLSIGFGSRETLAEVFMWMRPADVAALERLLKFVVVPRSMTLDYERIAEKEAPLTHPIDTSKVF